MLLIDSFEFNDPLRQEVFLFISCRLPNKRGRRLHNACDFPLADMLNFNSVLVVYGL